MLQNKFFWVRLSIGVVWLMVLLLIFFGLGERDPVPIAGMAMVTTIVLTIFGFRGSQGSVANFLCS